MRTAFAPARILILRTNQLNRPFQIVTLDWLGQIRPSRAVETVWGIDRLAVGRNQNERRGPVAAYLPNRLVAVHVRHADVGDDQVRLLVPARVDQALSIFSDGHHLMTQQRQNRAEILPHDRLIVPNGNSYWG